MSMDYVSIKLYHIRLETGPGGLQAMSYLPAPGLGDLQVNPFNSQIQVDRDVPILSVGG